MKQLTREWIMKAEGDFHTAARERRARTAPNYDAACFHAQQCVEKYLILHKPGDGLPHVVVCLGCVAGLRRHRLAEVLVNLLDNPTGLPALGLVGVGISRLPLLGRRVWA